MKQITAEQLIAEIRKVAAENPEYVYEKGDYERKSCTYSTLEGGKACIIGRALANLGISQEDLNLLDNKDEARVSYLMMDSSFPVNTSNSTRRQREWINRVQELQDDSVSWGEAVNQADGAYPLS